ncbi:hypothetical protein Ciccas_004585 [Cichlidogyrus casuarinus]|uniref:Alpha-and gamma-adaptin-binding protein p34 n=1 Tax=Cichlidogyrus casuarinus TaxID=1844966 RepID=A0ABD2QB34_9PLAT
MEGLVISCISTPYEEERFRSIFSHISGLSIPVKILIVKSHEDFAQEGIKKIMRTFHENDFELIEFEPTDKSLYEPEDYGINRLKEALSSHKWRFAVLSSGIPADETSSNNSETDHEEDCEDFEIIMTNLANLKASMDKMPDESKEEMAKKITREFWKAIDGEDGELDEMFDIVKQNLN